MQSKKSFEVTCCKCNKITFKLPAGNISETFVCPVCKADITEWMKNNAQVVERYNSCIAYIATQGIILRD